jgi:hypothetical protein
MSKRKNVRLPQQRQVVTRDQASFKGGFVAHLAMRSSPARSLWQWAEPQTWRSRLTARTGLRYGREAARAAPRHWRCADGRLRQDRSPTESRWRSQGGQLRWDCAGRCGQRTRTLERRRSNGSDASRESAVVLQIVGMHSAPNHS